MDWFNSIKRFYPRFWDEKMVGDAVICEKITPEQYKEITGLDYESPDQSPEVSEPVEPEETENAAPEKK